MVAKARTLWESEAMGVSVKTFKSERRGINTSQTRMHQEWIRKHVLGAGWPDIKTFVACDGDFTKAKRCVCGALVTARTAFGYTDTNNYCSRQCAAKFSVEKAKQTSVERFGSSHYSKTEEYITRRTKTNLERYGVEHVKQTEWAKEKSKRTNLERYGAEHYIQTEDGKKRTAETNVLRYGTTNPAANSEVKEKITRTFEERYGGHPMHSEMVKERQRQTMVSKYGVEHPSMIANPRASAIMKDETLLRNLYEKLGSTVAVGDFLGVNNTAVGKNMEKLGIPRNSRFSGLEKFFHNNISDVVEYNNRTILGGLEIDLYLPEHNIGIECHGEYWHASNSKFPKAPNYHFQKFLLAKSKGIRLFQFWGFEIIETPEDVLETIEKAKYGFKPDAERGFIKIDNMKPFIIDGNLYHLEEPKMTVWNGLELWDAGTSYYYSK